MRHIDQAWAGIDAAKSHHHVVFIDSDGKQLLSRRVTNDETDLVELIDGVCARVRKLSWAIDLANGPAALVIALLLERGQRLAYLPGVGVNRASAGYRGEGKTDAKDAAIIADQARMRRDLRVLKIDEQAIVELQMLTTHRADVASERTRTINRLRGRLSSIFPALEGILDFTNRGPRVLVTGFQTAQAIREVGADELARWLRTHKVRGADKLAAAAVRAAGSQHIRVGGEDIAATLIGMLARTVLDLDAQLADIDELIAARFRSHRHATVISSMVRIGDLLGAEFLAATGGDMTAFASADHLAGYAGLAPTPRDSGRRTGNLHHPRRYNRQLQRAFYTSALISIQRSPASRAYY
jgi:transposase